jgi:hypothetical protein
LRPLHRGWRQEPPAARLTDPYRGASSLPKRNYGFEKRQKELTKQRKKEEKAQRKLDRAKASSEGTEPEHPSPDGAPPTE